MQDACSQLFQSNLGGLILAVSKWDRRGRRRGLGLEKPAALPILENVPVPFQKHSFLQEDVGDLTDRDRC